MSTYRVNHRVLDASDPAFNDTLAQAHASKTRPLCLCREGGVEMYIAKITGTFRVKRMPNTGAEHAASCDSYEAPPELSGLGQVLGTAIQENADDGLTTIKLNFSLTKIAGRVAPAPSGGEHDSVKTDGTKLTLRGTLHYLWEQAGFNRWSPAMEGKRSWYVVRRYLIQAAEDKMAKGINIADILYIPEAFNLDKKEEITQRRVKKMMAIAAPTKGSRPLMIVMGEAKEISPSRYGHKIRFKHLPDCDFMMNEDLHGRLHKRFESELSLWDGTEGSRLIVIGTFSMGATGIPSLEEVALMVVTENWVPFESAFDKIVLDAMTANGRRFTKGLRYNLPSSKPLACIVASDTQPEPTGMYILPFGASEEFRIALDALMEESKLSQWLWQAGQNEMPPLPPLVGLSPASGE